MPRVAHHSAAPVDALEAFVGLVDEVDRDGDREAFYGSLAEAICRLSEMRRAIVFRYDPAKRKVTASGSHGIELDPFVDVPVNIETAAFAREALVEDRVTEATPPFDVPEPFEKVANAAPLVAVPMCAAGRMIGVVVGQRASAAEPLQDDQRHWLRSLGKVAALAAAARIATFEQQRSRSLEERIDLARDIHDRVVQRLFGVSLTLAAAPDQDLKAETRRRCSEELQCALDDLRAALERPLEKQPRQTQATLKDELERLAPKPSDGVQLSIDGDLTNVPAVHEPLAQVVLAEALNNARKHARASRIDITTRRSDGTFVLEICNDGVREHAVAKGPATGMGMGLRLAAFTALRVGGLVEFGPKGDDRWQVRLVVPDDEGEQA